MNKPRLKTYIVPPIVHGCFGCELQVEAESEAAAREAVLNGFGEMQSGDGFDWDRWQPTHQEIGTWGPIVEDKQ